MKNYRPTAKRWILTISQFGDMRVMVGNAGKRKWVSYLIDTKPALFRSEEQAMMARNCSRFANVIRISIVYV